MRRLQRNGANGMHTTHTQMPGKLGSERNGKERMERVPTAEATKRAHTRTPN